MKKTRLIAKVILLTLFLTVCALNASAQKVTLSFQNETFEKVLNSIKQQTGLSVVFSEQLVNLSRKVSIKVNSIQLEDALKQLLTDTNLSYEIKNNKLYLVEKKTVEPKSQPVKSKKISGLVTDEKGDPIIGASVKVINTNSGTISDIKGYFNVFAPADGKLLISYLGYKSQTITISENNNIKITLIEDSKILDEVVAIGYGTMKKKDLTGSVVSIKSEQLNSGSPVDVLGGIQGKLAGVMVSSASGDPSAGVDVTIRGYNSLAAGTSPLYVIDGIAYDVNHSEIANATVGENNSSNPLNLINPSDIESVTILKDASATSIYGSRGANGVIIIETKSGKKGHSLINLNVSLGTSQTSRKISVLNGNEFIEYRRDIDPGGYLFFYNANPEAPRDPYNLIQHNWQDEILRTGIQQNYDLSLSGKTDETTYSASLGYLNNEGIVKNNNYQRYSARIKIEHQKSRRMSIGFNSNNTYSVFNGATQSGGGPDLYNGIVQNLVTSTPVELYNPTFDRGDSYISPSSMIDKAYKESATLSSNTSAFIHYVLARGLTLMMSGSASISNSKGSEFYGKDTYWGTADKGYSSLSESKAYSLDGFVQLHYEKKINEDNSIKTMIASETNVYNYEWFNVVRTNFQDESTGVYDISKASTTKSSGSYRDNNKRVSFFGRINYSYKEKHLLTANFRADGSDKFGSGNRFGYFPSMAYSWLAINENFMKSQSLFSNAKLRLSYGLSGNDRIPSDRYLARLENSYYNGELGQSPSSQANKDLKWETTYQSNLGIDLGFLKNALTFSVDVYNKDTRDMLLEIPTAGQTGYSSQWQNAGKMNNKGIEVQLTSRNINKKYFKWTTDFNISRNINKVTDLNLVDFMTVRVPGAWIQDIGRVSVGRSLGESYGYVFDGVYQISDFTWQNNSSKDIPYAQRNYQLKDHVISVAGLNVKPGSFKFKDLNDDGVIKLDDDRKPISSSQPLFSGGITNTFQYKNFDLNVFIEGSYGNSIFNESKYRLEGGAALSYMNITKDMYYNHWTPDNQSNTHGDYADRNVTSLLASSYYVEDASYLRLKSLSFGYSLPQSVLKSFYLNSVRIYATANNILTLTKYSGFDPEVNSGNNLLSGVDRISYPRATTFLFGINIIF